MYFPGLYIDEGYILVLFGVVLSLIASAGVNNAFSKYSKIRNMRGITGAEAAERVLHSAGIYDVRIERVRGNLSDHYDPRSKVLRLSEGVHDQATVAAVGIASHECGHAIQHAQGYAPLQLRSVLVPVANFGSKIAWPLILIGLLFSRESSIIFIYLGIFAYLAAVLFQVITLPVEFNASRRAIQMIEQNAMLQEGEMKGTKKVLRAAALTYVAAALTSILQLVRIFLLAGGRRRND